VEIDANNQKDKPGLTPVVSRLTIGGSGEGTRLRFIPL
jgi:hypothetical protein